MTRVRSLVCTAFVIALVAIPAVRASACTCATQSPREHLAAAGAVFVGTATSVERSGGAPTRAQIAVTDVYKGSVSRSVVVETPTRARDGSAPCTFEFVAGTRYVLFADGDPARGFRVTSCGHSGDDLSVLERARAGRPVLRYAQQPTDPDPLTQDGPGVARPGAPKSGPVAAAFVLLVASAVGTFAAYRSGVMTRGRSRSARH